MGAQPPEVTLVVVTYNSAQPLRAFFDALASALADVDGHEVVVADNASCDETLELVSELAPGATVVGLGRNAGYAAGINAAVSRAVEGTRAVLVCNPDVRLHPGSVRRLLDALQGQAGGPGGRARAGRAAGPGGGAKFQDPARTAPDAVSPEVGIVVPRLVEADGRLALSLRREPKVLRALGEALLGGRRAGWFPALGEIVCDPRCYQRPGSADWASGAVMLISRRCLEQVGPWDETFFLYSEETEFALRARDAGFVLRYVPDAVATHLGGDRHTSSRLWALLAVNRVRLYSRRHGPVRTAAFWAAVALNEALRALSGRGVHRAALRALLRPSTWTAKPMTRTATVAVLGDLRRRLSRRSHGATLT